MRSAGGVDINYRIGHALRASCRSDQCRYTLVGTVLDLRACSANQLCYPVVHTPCHFTVSSCMSPFKLKACGEHHAQQLYQACQEQIALIVGFVYCAAMAMKVAQTGHKPLQKSSWTTCFINPRSLPASSKSSPGQVRTSCTMRSCR